MTYTNKDLERLQKILIDVLFKIDKLCKKHNLNYFAIAGTLLGAVRHGDFIPWDDDIDIGMLRPEYDLFIELAKKELPDDLFCLNYGTFPNVPITFTKICKKGTLFVEKESRNLKYPHCVFVDILPIDFSPSDEKIRKKHLKQIRFWSEIYKSKSLWGVSAISSKRKKIIGSILRPLLHICLLPISKKFIFTKLETVSKKYISINKEEAYVSYKGKPSMEVEFNKIFPFKQSRFSKLNIPIPNDSDAVLKKEFGDYMVLPPKDKRFTHCPYRYKF